MQVTAILALYQTHIFAIPPHIFAISPISCRNKQHLDHAEIRTSKMNEFMRVIPRQGLLALWLLVVIALLVNALPVFISIALAKIYTKEDNLALNGYDPVAYFTKSEATLGSEQFAIQHKGVVWNFTSAEHKAQFEADPDKYEPQYGGYCAWAAADKKKLAPGDPKIWKIVEGKLYVNYNKGVQKIWEKDIPRFITQADANWPDLVKKAIEKSRDKSINQNQ